MTADLQKLPKWQNPPPTVADARADKAFLATVSLGFVEDWLQSLQRISGPADYSRLLHQAGFRSAFLAQPSARLTHDQFVKLYQVFATGTGDEMMGLWSRSIRSGSLKYLCKTVIDAPSIITALYRFTRFWNLLLDDYALDMVEEADTIRIVLRPYQDDCVPNRFGHTPRDWIFTAFKEHALQLKVREFLYVNDYPDWTLERAARFLNMSPRTLIRKLAAEDRSFQAIKDGLRRDIAIRDLKGSSKSMDEISWSIGFTSSAVFHRAFKNWTGMTPGEYRRAFPVS